MLWANSLGILYGQQGVRLIRVKYDVFVETALFAEHQSAERERDRVFIGNQREQLQREPAQ